ncbi:hypothetical protein [Flagellimonas marina]|uniref:Secreted protein n=1 Tax=Flagellimonas marina TaxID=1775168 RepID=A0ABV8PIK1_9FLAO
MKRVIALLALVVLTFTYSCGPETTDETVDLYDAIKEQTKHIDENATEKDDVPDGGGKGDN